jgi:hypothetical protein
LILCFTGYVIYYNNTKSNKQIKYKEVIQKELKETGKLVVLEGTTQYKTAQEEAEKLLGTIEIGNRTLILDLQFKYGYSVDLSAIDVDVSDDISLIVDSKSIVLDYIYLDVDNSFIESSSTLLAKSYTSEEINEIQKVCIQNVKDELLKNEENIQKAKTSLEKQLNSMIFKVTNKQAVVRYE